MEVINKRIGELDPALAVEDDSKFPMEQQGEAVYATGEQIRKWAQDTASVYVESAIEAAASAEKSAAEAAESLSLIGDSVTNAQNAQAGAETAAEEAKQYSGKPPKPEGGTWQIWNAATQTYEDSGVSSSLTINHSYPSVAAMEADFPNTKKNDLAIISAGVEQEDTAKLYINNGERWVFLADLSGVQGAPGVGISRIELTSGDHSPGTTDVYTIKMTDGTTSTFSVYNGVDGQSSGDMQGNSFDLTIPAAGWSDHTITIFDSRFLAAAKYSYVIGPATNSRDTYIDCGIKANDITTNGEIVLQSDDIPADALTIHVTRSEITNSTGGNVGKVYTAGGGGGGGGGMGPYQFHVNDGGHLILTYAGNTPPDFEIKPNGHLVLTV